MTVFRGSRYERSGAFSGGTGRFKGVLPRHLPSPEPVIEHAIAVQDRLDALGQNYYREPRLWHRLAEANPETLFAEDLLHDRSADERSGRSLVVPQREEGQP